jgi:DedD protein
VQVGSFSSRATADRLAAELKAQRYSAFVMPVKTQNSTLYRVRIGPMTDRAAADDVLKRIKAKHSGAAVVAHP